MWMIGAVHLSPWATIPPGAAIVLLLAWYWWRLASPGVPESRRRIRRVSLLCMMATVPVVVAALSIFDPDAQTREYLIAWTIVIGLLVAIVLTAVMDGVNNLRLHARWQSEETMHATRTLIDALKARREADRDGAGTGNGQP